MSAGDWKEMFKGVQENDFDLVRYHLEREVDPNYQHPEFMALPLAESMRYNNVEITKLLLLHGANPLIIEMESGITTVEMAARMKNQEVIDLLNSYI